MDYLPRPRDSVPGIDVPLVEIIPYDFGSYENFPERHGYTRSDGSWDTEQSPDRLASLLQSWLYFGLLAEFFSTPVDVQKFTSCGQDGRAKLVTAASVKDLIKANYSRDNSFWFGGWERGQLNITCLKSAERALNEYRNLDEFPYPVPPIVLSVQLLIQALLIIFADDAYLSPDSRIPDFDSRFLREHMLNLGWCPRQVKQLSEQNVLVTLYYLATLRRRSPHRLNHTECSRDKCIAYNVKGNVYRSRHTKEDCNCSYISIPTKAVKDIIRRGSIPLMSIRRQKNGERTFSVEEAKSSSDYIAISHVWSDGRGNRNANALLDCQVQELENMFLHQPHIVMSRSLKRSVQPFWMDTLCIPVGDDEDALDLKARAINQMAFIYTSARNVFVLDSELRLSRLATSTSLEIYAYVYCSAWMQRCWTFQEGSLAQKCFFWCADGAVNPLNESEYEDVNDFRWETGWGFTVKTIWQILQFFYHEPIQILYHKYMAPSLLFQPSRKKWADPIHEFVLQTLRNRCQGFLEKPKVYHDEQFPEVFAAPRLSVERFIDVWNVISERTTTESEDILTILANLLDLNAYQLQKLPPQLRLKAIVFALGAIPSSLLFISGPRLDVEGVSDDRWIPTSLNGDKLDNFLPHIPIEQDGIYLGSSGMTMILFTRGSHNRYGPFSVNTPDRRLKIVFDLNDASCLDADALAKTAIVYPRRYHKKNFHRDFKGACFFVSNDGYNSRRRGRLIQATFDCSVTLFWAEKDDARLGSNQLERTQEARGRDDADASIKEAEFLSITRSDGYEENDYDNSEDVWELKMSYDPYNIPLVDTLLVPNPRASTAFVISFLFFVYGPVAYAMIGVRIKIAADLGWSTLSSIGRASLVLWYPELQFFFGFILPISPILFIIDRVSCDTGLRGLDIAYLVLTFVAIQGLCLFYWIVTYIEKTARFRLYLQSFREGWSVEEMNLFWRINRAFLRLTPLFFRYYISEWKDPNFYLRRNARKEGKRESAKNREEMFMLAAERLAA